MRIFVTVSLSFFLLLSQQAAVAAAKTQQPVKKVAQKTLSWAGCGISKKAFMKEVAAAFEKKTGVKINLKGGGATRGIREVANRTRDLGGSCRYTLENPKTLSVHNKERRVKMDPVAWDALVVLVHKTNPVNNITLADLRKVFVGKITNWKQLGGKNARIQLFYRKGKFSGVGRTVRELIFANYNQEFTKNATIVKSSGPLEKGIQGKAVNGIGVSGISSARKRKVKILSLEGKKPTYENIKNGSYLLYRPLFLVTHLQNKDPDVRAFSSFVHGREAEKIMRKGGTVPYGDAIHLWLKYLSQVEKAQKRGLHY